MTQRAGRQASIRTVAAEAGVSIATVSRIVNGVANKAAPATVERVREAIAALDYRPASAGRALRQQSSRLVAVLAANLANPAMSAMAASVEVALRQQGLVMTLCDTHDRPELQDEYLREMLAHQARAFVLLAAVESPLLADLRTGPRPLIFVNRRDPAGGPASRYVGIDNVAAGRDVARHCLSTGSLPAALIHGSLASSATSDRVRGLLSAFADAGRPLAPDAVIGPAAEDHLTIGHAGVDRLVKASALPKMLICTSDLIAFGAHRRLRDEPGAMPRLIGFDDSPLNDWIAPWLTSIRIPYEDFGAAIMSLLAENGETAGPAARIQAHRLVIRPEAG